MLLRLPPPRRLLPFASFAALFLSGCQDGVELTNASIAEVAAASASIARPDAGAWRTEAMLTAFDPGAQHSPMAEALAAQLGKRATTEACLSAADASQPLFGDLTPTQGANCMFRRFTLVKGRLDAEMTCRNAAGQRLEVSQRGAYASDRVDLTATVKRTEANGVSAGGMTTHVRGKRIGECSPG